MYHIRLSVSLVIVGLLVGCESPPTDQVNPSDLLIDAALSGTVIEVSPTGTPVDLENVRTAIQDAQPGDVIHLKAGTFDFSNAYVYVGDPDPIDNRICLRSDITIEGESGTELRGPGRDFPNDPVDGFSVPFNGGGEKFGVPCPPFDNVTIRNLTIREFTRGLVLGFYDPSHTETIQTEGVQILGNTLRDIRIGIVAGGLIGSEIAGNTLTDVTMGLQWLSMRSSDYGPSDLRFENNDVSAENVAILLVVYEDGNPDVLRGLEIVANRLFGYFGGIQVEAGDPLIEGNEIETHGVGIAFGDWSGGEVYSVADATIDENRIRLLEPVVWDAAGMSLKGCSDETIVNNDVTARGCLSHGIHLNGCSGSEITDNVIIKTGNYANGIRLESGSNDNVLTHNTIHGSGDHGSYGIFVYGSDNNQIDENTVTETGTDEGCLHPAGSVICAAYYADDNNGAFLVDAEGNTVANNNIQVDKSSWGAGNAVRLGGSANFCEGEVDNIVAYNMLAGGAQGVSLSSTTTGTAVMGNMLTGSQEGRGISFHSCSDNTITGNTVTGWEWGLWFRETSTDNVVEHNNVYANNLAVYNQQAGGVDVRHNYWGTPCPPTALFEEATGSIEWFPQLTSLYPPAMVAEDENGDRVADVCSRCAVTAAENVPTDFLLPDHYAEIDGDGVFDINVGSANLTEIVGSALTLVDTYGCTCQQILEWKPGNNTGEIQFGCTESTMTTWVSQIDWAAKK